MNRWNIALATALLGLTLAVPAVAQWKWRDQAGRTQYSDLPPPPGVPEGDILQRPAAGGGRRNVATPAATPASAASAAAAPLSLARASDPALEARRKQAEQAVSDEKKAEEQRNAAARAENCTRAKAQVRDLDSGLRIARTNEKGEREIMDDTMRAAEAKRARAIVTADCK